MRLTYSQALKDVDRNIQNLDMDINGIQATIDMFDDFGGSADDKAQLQSMLQSKIYQKQYQQAIQEQLDDVMNKLHKNAYATVDEYLNDCYSEAFIGTAFDLHGQDIPLIMPMDQESIVRAVQLDSKISKGLYFHMGESVNNLKKTITNEVSRGLVNGSSYAKIAQQIRFKMVGTYDNPGGALAYAMRIARTEGHRIQCQAAMDACYKAKDMGADIVKQWDSTMDGRTRSSHRHVDGEIRELDETFSNGLKYPGDPSCGAAEVVNCRCALLERAKWALDEDELQTLKDRAKYFNLDKSDNFEDFKKNYLRAAEQSAVQSAVNAASFTPAKTTDEAEEFVKRYVNDKQFGATGVSYSGISVDSANAVNQALFDLYENYDIEQLGGVYVAKGNTKLGKAVDGATAAYAHVRKSLIINNRSMKNLDDVAKAHAEELDIIKMYASDPTSVKLKTKRAENVVKASMKSGRATVPENIDDVIHHEMGHHIERTIKQSDSYDVIKANMPKYAENISGYATIDEGEYIAESFASYLKGEDVIDPEMKKLFDKMKR